MGNSGREIVGKLKKTFWPEDSVRPINMWAVLDGAKDKGVFDVVTRCYLDKSCLFSGELTRGLEMAAPHLVQISPRDSASDRLLESGWGQAWGIFIHSDDPMRILRRHLKTLLRVRDESGRFLLFRYYDPRVLRIYLPTCLAGELRTVFGTSIIKFHMESEDPRLIITFQLNLDGQLIQNVVAL